MTAQQLDVLLVPRDTAESGLGQLGFLHRSIKAVIVEDGMHDITPVAVSAKNVLWHFHQRLIAKWEVKCTQSPQIALSTTVASKSEFACEISNVVGGQQITCMEW